MFAQNFKGRTALNKTTVEVGVLSRKTGGKSVKKCVSKCVNSDVFKP